MARPDVGGERAAPRHRTGGKPDARAHPGREWMVVLSGTAVLLLGNRRFRVETNQAAEFPTMLPHAIGSAGGPTEILGIFDRDARRSHRSDDSD